MKLPRWLLVAFGCASLTSHLHGAETVEHEGAKYHLFRVAKADWPKLQLAWLGADGRPLGDFNGLRRDLAAKGQKIAFAMNAGIFERGPKPCGLTICGGKVLVELNLRPGEGNFYLMPNGVFFLDDEKGPGVMEAAEFGRSGLKPRLATQSGPLTTQIAFPIGVIQSNMVALLPRSSVVVQGSSAHVRRLAHHRRRAGAG